MTDALLTVATVGLAVVLWPTVRKCWRGEARVPLATSVPSAFFLALIAASLFLLGQVGGGAVSLVTAILWFAVALAELVRARVTAHVLHEFGKQNGHNRLTWTEGHELTKLRRYDRLDREDCS